MSLSDLPVRCEQCLTLSPDVYNMQLSNEPAEALAKYLVETSNGAFEMVGFVSGGIFFK